MNTERPWFALYTKPNREYAVRDHLTEKDVQVFLPEIQNKTQRRDRPARRPFFPQYRVARLDLENGVTASIPWTPGLRTIVSFGGRPAPIPHELIAHIRRRLAEMDAAGPADPFKQGEWVRVTGGPLEGLDAMFDRALSRNGRVRVFLACMNRLMAAELYLADLAPSR